jgi:hypothetical protein
MDIENQNEVVISGWLRKDCWDIAHVALFIRRCSHGFHARCSEIGFEKAYPADSMKDAIAVAVEAATKAVALPVPDHQ